MQQVQYFSQVKEQKRQLATFFDQREYKLQADPYYYGMNQLLDLMIAASPLKGELSQIWSLDGIRFYLQSHSRDKRRKKMGILLVLWNQMNIIFLITFVPQIILPLSQCQVQQLIRLFIPMAGNKKRTHEKKERRSDEQDQAYEQPPQKEEQPQETNEEKFQPIPPKKVSYCPVCTFPFELCKYGKEAPQCAAFLYKLAPTKVNKYHPDFKPEQLEALKEKKQEPKEEGEEGKEKQPVKGGKEVKSLKDKYVVIDMKNRGKKNFITTVSGLNNFNIDAKDVAKKCSKKFAVSCSAIELGTVQLQGDNSENMKEFLLAEYKQLKKKYIIDKEEFVEKEAEEKAKRKEARKLEKGAIKEEPEEQEEKPVEIVKDKNTIRMEMMQKAAEEEEDD